MIKTWDTPYWKKTWPMKIVCGFCKDFIRWSEAFKPSQIGFDICSKCAKSNDPKQFRLPGGF